MNRIARAIGLAVSDPKPDRRMSAAESVDIEQFEKIFELPHWAALEQKFPR